MSLRVQDYCDIQSCVPKATGDWYVMRCRRPGARIRVLAAYRSYQKAGARYDRERIAMRQGMLALVNPEGQIVEYACESMVRSRW